LVYHRISLTHINLFRFIRFRFVREESDRAQEELERCLFGVTAANRSAGNE